LRARDIQATWSRLPPLLLDDVARVLAEVAGMSLRDGLDPRLVDGLDDAARASGQPLRVFARQVIARDPRAIEALVDHVAVSETAFWRHPGQLAAVGRIAAAAVRPLAIWSAGCATGEEPYSIALALLEAGRAGRGDRILATDVSSRALEVARAAVYGVRPLRRLPHDVAGRWLEELAGSSDRRVRPEARALVSFARHNVLHEPPPGGPFDLVLCRNVLIYFDGATAADVIRRLAASLAPGGRLLLGPVELPFGEAAGLRAVDEGGATLLARR
jgi:chemotaxis protein methyltransferase CheR